MVHDSPLSGHTISVLQDLAASHTISQWESEELHHNIELYIVHHSDLYTAWCDIVICWGNGIQPTTYKSTEPVG